MVDGQFVAEQLGHFLQICGVLGAAGTIDNAIGLAVARQVLAHSIDRRYTDAARDQQVTLGLGQLEGIFWRAYA